MTDLALPRARARSRRRRLPRPPKFTTLQKLLLAWFVVWTLASVVGYVQNPAPSLLLVATAAIAAIHAIVLDALRPPRGGNKSYALATAMIALALAVSGH